MEDVELRMGEAILNSQLSILDFEVDASEKVATFTLAWTNTLFDCTASRDLYLFASTNLLDPRWMPLGAFTMPPGTNFTFAVTTNDVDSAALPWFLESMDGIGFFFFGADVDTDGDGLTDTHERRWAFTSPYLPDTDFDGVSDPDEMAAGLLVIYSAFP